MSLLEWMFLIAVIRGADIGGDEIAGLVRQGIPSARYQFPYIVRIYVKTNSYQPLCMGSIVAPRIVLTAGHCCARSGTKVVVTRNKNRKRFYKEAGRREILDLTGHGTHRVQQEIIHPQFEEKNCTTLHDVCLLRLRRPMNSSEDLKVVVPVTYGRLYARKCTAIGHRSVGNSCQLQLHYKQVFGEAAWRGIWLIRVHSHSVYDTDSGGPLLCAGKLYGVASFSTTSHFNGAGDYYYAYLREERDFLENFISGSIGIFTDTLFFLTVILVTAS